MIQPRTNGEDLPEQNPSNLSQQQLARVEALREARSALAPRSFGGVSGPVDVLDLMRLARFIETGKDDLIHAFDDEPEPDE